MSCIKHNHKHSLKKVKCSNTSWFSLTGAKFKEVEKSILKGGVYLFNIMCNNTFNYFTIVISLHNMKGRYCAVVGSVLV